MPHVKKNDKTVYHLVMYQILQKIPFLIELFFNGSFILLYSLKKLDKLPSSWNQELIQTILGVGTFIIPFVLLLTLIVNYLNSVSLDDFIRKYVFSLIVFVPLVLTWGDVEFAFWLASAHLLSTVLALYDSEEAEDGSKKRVERSEHKSFAQFVFEKIQLMPAQIVLLSFVGVIMLGTFLLMLPVSSVDGKAIDFVDAIFMATSATCVTGLTTLSLPQNFTLFGQIVILILIQIGGLGIMTLSSSMTILLGKSMAMKDRIIMQDLLDVSSLEDLLMMIVDIVKYTLIIELWGGIILTIAFTFEGFEFSQALYNGFFHSISAFCNAGFSLFDNSLESYATSPLVHGTVSILITLGGLGFIVLKDLREVALRGKSVVRLALHSKVVLIASAVLTVGGSVFFFFGEFLNAIDSYTLWEKVQISVFQSVTLRTAGFNTIPLSNLNTYTIYAMTLFMFIGASPGSTGGGIKTTTLAILFQSIKSTLKGRSWVGLLDRKVPSPIVVRVTALTFISILVTTSFILIMMRLEPSQSFLTVFFEVISAGGTVGLSLGITPYLSVLGKLAISVLMLVGRIGPLTLVLAVGEQKEFSGKYEYPDGRIMIG